MVGKSMRCPKCQEVFLVQDAGPAAGSPSKPVEKLPPTETPPRTRTDAPPVVSRSGNVTDFVPVIKDVSTALPPPKPTPPPPVAPPKPREAPRVEKYQPPTAAEFPWEEEPRKTVAPPPPRETRPPAGIKPPTPAEFPWEEAPKAKPVLAPRETKWRPDKPPPPVETPIDLLPVDDEPGSLEPVEVEAPPPRRAAKKKRGFAILVLLILFVIGGLGTSGFFVWRYINTAPERLNEAAQAEYDKNNFEQARGLYEKLAKEHPDHRLAPRARFFTELSATRHSINSVMTKEDPQPALNQWNKLLTAIQEPELGGFAEKGQLNIDIWDAGKRLAEAIISMGNSSFSEDNPDAAEKWLKEAMTIDTALDRFRPDDIAKSEGSLSKDISSLKERIDVARAILVKLDEVKRLLADGSDENVQRAADYAKKVGVDNDPRLTKVFRDKEEEIQAKAIYTREPQSILPTPLPDDGLTSLLFAPRFDRGERRPIAGQTAVFFCLARGVLYALDEADGHVLWAARTGLDTDIMPVRVPASALHPELVLLASNTGNQFGISARSARNGAPIWHHLLAVPCQGPPAVVGPNAYVSLGDKDGTILEIILATGEITGKITVGRALGPNLSPRPHTGFLYIPAESRAVYVFDVDRHDPDGKRLDPVLLGVMNTGHAAGSLRGVPVFSNPDPNEPGPKYFVMGQADGLDSMKLRAFKLPETPDGKPESSPVATEIALPGWASFPPYCDGEKLAIVTDKGEFGLYGLALAGNRDLAMFAFPQRAGIANDPRPSRGQVVLAEEGSFWILAAGELRKLRFGINANEGVRLVPHGDPVPAGEPLHAPQVNARGDTFVVVTQDGMTCRATAVDAITGQVRWRRELGLMAKGDPLRVGDAILMLDQGGGIYRIDTKPLIDRGNATWLVDEKWMILQPARGFAAYTGLLRGPNGSAIAVLVGEGEKANELLVRRYTGERVEDRELNMLAPLAGPPVVSGQMLIFPLANGTLYRLPLGGRQPELQEGPSWRAERLSAATHCYLAAIDDDELFATDGSKSIVRWRWPAATKLFETQGRLTPQERVAATPVVLPGSLPRLVIADNKGNLTMWDADKLSPPALKAWKPGGRSALPAGPIADGLRFEKDPDGSLRIVYSVGGRLVWLSPDADGPKWVGPVPLKAVEGRPAISGQRIYLTDRAGVVRVLDLRTGYPISDEFRLTGSHAFASAAIPITEKLILAPLADGTVVLGQLKARKEEPPKKQPDAESTKDQSKSSPAPEKRP
jgi:outer membrane protein assembly factor BamB